MDLPPTPAPRWCRICKTLVEGLEFAAPHRAHAAHAAAALPPTPHAAAREKWRFACIKCGRDFARFTQWETHEAACMAEKKQTTTFKRVKPVICKIAPKVS